ncbi:16S rRNA (adenine(1518)-N(6)/adenine(1519)-N(6))-dimethyltransferase RsmA [Paenalcaligenes faecalis]|uniref:16S rRNA (adenine(1518)-N(6)/adenine(1519)-N(6))- dimethyltransferase RsmA n=1 Tax=Paenalcaligenes faecalis TaxID=2980099 RepID=UPI0022B9CDD0|nr:16S rRNA (adenine(1518)-N(6)/adenine(1519)-N(6))-dimethyltransferase RsmA [Paenalcaligenes faecalis]
MQQHQARKRFGQNFLHDEGVIHQIVRAIDPQSADKLIEIGPGMSALTQPLFQAVDQLTVVEIDRDLVQFLQKKYAAEKLTIISADVLTVDFAQFGDGLRIVGNLPYNISSPLLFHLMQYADQIVDQHFMLQKEVIDRMAAKPGDPLYGRLSVMLQSRYRIIKLFDVAPESFTPAPKVISAVVRMRPLKADRPQAKDAAVFEKVVAQAFSQRRKMLRGVLAQWADHIDWDAVGIAPTDRADAVGLSQFIALSDMLTPLLAKTEK